MRPTKPGPKRPRVCLRAPRAALLFATLLAAAGCAAQDEFPAGLYTSCTSDTDCSNGYECLESPDPTGDVISVMACTRSCDEVSECPRVWSRECGEQTRCAGGVCTYVSCP